MRISNYFIWLGVSAAAGAALGLLVARGNAAKGSLIGAATGVAAGSVAAGIYQGVTSGDKVPYYSRSSPLYDDSSAV